MSEAIDAVISWVDGYDPIFQEKLRAFCDAAMLKQRDVIEPTRILHCNEIHYCLQALARFAPWLRNIFIITNEQKPAAIDELTDKAFASKIKVVNQNELLQAYQISTPIFNSISVEWLIWRIPGLSEKFLYLNDDFFMIRPVTPADFFRDNAMVLRGHWKTQVKHQWLYRVRKKLLMATGHPVSKPKTTPHRDWQEQSARLAGWPKRFYLLPHAPFPLLKSTFENMVQKNPALFTENVSYPFRDANQISSVPLMVHDDIKHRRVVYESPRTTMMVHGGAHLPQKIRSRLRRAEWDQRVAFVCMQSMEQASLEVQHEMKEWLERQLLRPI